MTRRKKNKNPIDDSNFKTYEVVVALRWDDDIEYAVNVKAPNPDAAYASFKNHMATINKSASKRGDDTLDTNIWKKPKSIMEVVDEHFQGIK